MSDRPNVFAVPDLHEIVWVRGPATIRFLDGLVSQDIAAMEPAAVGHSLLLAPNGKLRALLVVWRGEDEVGLVVGHGTGEITASDLRRFKIRVDASIDREVASIVTVVGDGSAAVLERAGVPVSGDLVWSRDPIVGPVPFVNAGSERYVVVGLALETLLDAGASPASTEDVEALRIEHGEPRIGTDVDDSTIPQEMGAVDHAVSFTKGCFLGQELVARIDSRGRVNRHLRGLVLAGDAAPAGADIVSDDTVVGRLTSVAPSARLGAVIGLGLVRREVEPGDDVLVRWDGGSDEAVVRTLPLD